MPVPKRKTSKARRNKRHANKGLDVTSFTHCANSGSAVASHTVCLESGYYKGVKVLVTKKERQEARGKKRQEQEAKAQQKHATMTKQQEVSQETASTTAEDKK